MTWKGELAQEVLDAHGAPFVGLGNVQLSSCQPLVVSGIKGLDRSASDISSQALAAPLSVISENIYTGWLKTSL